MKTLLLHLLLTPMSLFAQCGGNISFTLDTPPNVDLTYPPGTVVELCVTMDGWNGNGQGSNWFEGFGLTLGNGWISSTPTLTPSDAGADNSGTWVWVNTVTSSQTGLTVGPGFFFEGPQGPTDGNPGNDWGDYCASGNCIWEFCTSLTADVVTGLSLDIQVTPYGDGTMGSWTNPACTGQDASTPIFGGTIGCVTCGCTDPLACNYDPIVCCDDGSCDYLSMGVISPSILRDTICTNLEATYSVTGNPNSSYSWIIEGGDIVPTTDPRDCKILWGDMPGTYTITAQEVTQTGCIGPIESYEVIVETPDIQFNPPQSSICLNQSIPLNAYPISGVWDSEFMNGSTFVGTNPGTHYPTYTTNIYGCDITESVEIQVRRKYEAPEIIYSSDVIDLCFDFSDQTYVAEDSVGVTYGWFIDQIKQFSTENYISVEWYDTTRTYTIKVIAYDALGCESEPKLISVRTESCQRFFAPNSFTPNGDGTNDIFEIKGLSVYRPTMKIFNRWGVEVYTSSNLWWTGDGGSGYYCDNGVYNWIVEYKDKYGFNKQESGFVTLIR